ncbi:hypothetical protein ACH4VX_33195 [Streptomyces sp. NPDC020731]|uniref:hypothetical protein n=1 Tax=Streptomyces sp. NPDC020731 TaxID=3365085 RepID=UPI0037B1C3D9
MTREHVTAAAPDPAPRRRTVEQQGYVSPAYARFAAEQERRAAEAAADHYRPPETREQLLAMCSADQVRTFEEHRTTYDRLMLGE